MAGHWSRLDRLASSPGPPTGPTLNPELAELVITHPTVDEVPELGRCEPHLPRHFRKQLPRNLPPRGMGHHRQGRLPAMFLDVIEGVFASPVFLSACLATQRPSQLSVLHGLARAIGGPVNELPEARQIRTRRIVKSRLPFLEGLAILP